MDRQPKKPPFPVGARLRYVGQHQGWFHNKAGERVPSCVPGLEVVIVRTTAGRRGTLAPLYEDGEPMVWDDTGEPILDETKDGYSVYEVHVDDKTYGRCIFPEAAKQWERVA